LRAAGPDGHPAIDAGELRSTTVASVNLPRLWAAIAAGSFIAVLVGGKLLTPAPDQPTLHPDSVVTSVTSSKL
jgi:hypothetical protein